MAKKQPVPWRLLEDGICPLLDSLTDWYNKLLTLLRESDWLTKRAKIPSNTISQIWHAPFTFVGVGRVSRLEAVRRRLQLIGHDAIGRELRERLDPLLADLKSWEGRAEKRADRSQFELEHVFGESMTEELRCLVDRADDCESWLRSVEQTLLAETVKPVALSEKTRKTKTKKPTVKLGNNPQITIEGEPHSLTFEQAHWLKALIDAGDCMSDRKYNRDNNTPNSRPDRLRKDLPVEVLAHITTTNIGSRWL